MPHTTLLRSHQGAEGRQRTGSRVMNLSQLMVSVGDQALITTDNWFYAPDGKSYRAAFGTVQAIRSSEIALGVKTNSKSTNWYVEVGNMRSEEHTYELQSLMRNTYAVFF